MVYFVTPISYEGGRNAFTVYFRKFKCHCHYLLGRLAITRSLKTINSANTSIFLDISEILMYLIFLHIIFCYIMYMVL